VVDKNFLKQLTRQIPWENPIDFTKKIIDQKKGEDLVFLYSGIDDKKSFLALNPIKKIICEDFLAAEKILKNSEEKWFGYLSYELAHDFENIPKTKKSFLNLPKIWLINFGIVFEFDHKKKLLSAIYKDELIFKKFTQHDAARQSDIDVSTPTCLGVKSNFTDKSYLEAISKIKNLIARGDLYQTNLTRKFFGKFDKNHNQKTAFKTFVDLIKLSPANYSSFLSLDKNFIISSSPELFFNVKNNKIISRPIKGTAPRGLSDEEDRKNKSELKKSTKERAENLMIVDLVRNDLARICKAGTVEVKNLFKINSYKNIHHMSSEVHGRLDEKYSILDSLRALFPPGSMTGAPKIKAMEIAAKNEKINRGVYSGAIGFFDNKSANFSVVIRTLILQKNKFEFQSGGAITFDSDPKKELAEIYSKAKSLINLLT
jgi:para-aminobenzoate synthetase component 1